MTSGRSGSMTLRWQMSFGFMVPEGGDNWIQDEDGHIWRTIERISPLLDVSPVTYPAYPQTTVSVRDRYRSERALQQLKQLLQSDSDPDEARARLAVMRRQIELQEAQL